MVEEQNGYRGTGSIGGKLGCAFSALVGLPLLVGAVLANILGDCLPQTQCDRSLDWGLIGGAMAIAAAIGFASRYLVNAVARWLRSRS